MQQSHELMGYLTAFESHCTPDEFAGLRNSNSLFLCSSLFHDHFSSIFFIILFFHHQNFCLVPARIFGEQWVHLPSGSYQIVPLMAAWLSVPEFKLLVKKKNRHMVGPEGNRNSVYNEFGYNIWRTETHGSKRMDLVQPILDIDILTYVYDPAADRILLDSRNPAALLYILAWDDMKVSWRNISN